MNKNVLNFILLSSLLLLSILGCKKKNDGNNDTTNSNPIWNTLFSDDFNQADGPVDTINKYLVQVACTPHTGIASISSNKLQFSGSGCWAIRYTGSVTNNRIKVSGTFTTGNSFGSFGFTLKGKNLGNNWQQQEFYGAFVMNDTIIIQKYVGMSSSLLAKKYFRLEPNHTFNLVFTLNQSNLTFNIENTFNHSNETITAINSGQLLTGPTVSINGYSSTNSDLLLIDDLKIEISQ